MKFCLYYINFWPLISRSLHHILNFYIHGLCSLTNRRTIFYRKDDHWSIYDSILNSSREIYVCIFIHLWPKTWPKDKRPKYLHNGWSLIRRILAKPDWQTDRQIIYRIDAHRNVYRNFRPLSYLGAKKIAFPPKRV